MRTFPLGPDEIPVTSAHSSVIPSDIAAEIKGLGHGAVMAMLGSGFSNMVKDIRNLGIYAIGVDPVYNHLKNNSWELDLIEAKVNITDEMLMNLCRIFFQEAKEHYPEFDLREIAYYIEHRLDAYFSSVASAEQSYSNLLIIPGGKVPMLPPGLQDIATNIPQMHRESFREWMHHYERHSSQYYFAGYAENLPFDNQSVHAIFSWDFLHPHVTKTGREFMLENILQEIRRVLVPGGKIFIGPLKRMEEALSISVGLEKIGLHHSTHYSKGSRVVVFQRTDEQPPKDVA